MPLRHSLKSHTVSTAYELGWSELKNGQLLQEAELQFDLFITTDQKLLYQQNLSNRKLAILVLPFASWPRLQDHVSQIQSAVDKIKSGEYLELNF